MSKIFVTSDTHFNHKRIIELQNRPFRDVDEMNAALVANWNSVVSGADLVYHLGDFSFAGKDSINEFSNQLNGSIVLVCGNHDYEPRVMSEHGRFAFATKDYGMEYEGHMVLMAHRPLDFEHVHGRFRSNLVPVFLYGHVHGNGLKEGEDGLVKDGKFTGTPWSANMGVELWQYRPVELYKVIDFVQYKHSVSLPEHTKEFQFE